MTQQLPSIDSVTTNSSQSVTDSTATPVPRQTLPFRTVRPIGAYALQGLTTWEGRFLALDAIRGYLLQIDPHTDNTTILNTQHADEFVDASGLAIWENTLWFVRESAVYFCPMGDFAPRHFIDLPYPGEGIAVWESTVYVASQRHGYISIFDRQTRRLITRLAMPGVGTENLLIHGEDLWVSDRLEQTVYCLDRATGEEKLRLLTPFEEPTGLTFFTPPAGGDPVLYVAYAQEEPFIRDDPRNPELPYELSFRDRTFLHPLYFRHVPEQHYALSNGFLIEMTYVEELLPLEDIQDLQQVEWRIALPIDTDRQKVRSVEPVGLPFTTEMQDGQPIAVFRFDHLPSHERHLFGWKAQLEVYGIKYLFNYEKIERLPPLSPEFQARYLVDDDDLAMDTPVIREAARVAIGSETNLLRKLLKIRNFVYDKLSYRLNLRSDTPDVVLARGTGSCGEYVGLLLALSRLNGIACRTIGRYKCPKQADYHHLPLEPDFNHVWIEFYLPGYGWLPMESNPDDVSETGPYPTRFFMGLPWQHVEMGKGVPFHKLITADPNSEVSVGDLGINHVRFTILGELIP